MGRIWRLDRPRGRADIPSEGERGKVTGVGIQITILCPTKETNLVEWEKMVCWIRYAIWWGSLDSAWTGEIVVTFSTQEWEKVATVMILENWSKSGEWEMGICPVWGEKVEVLSSGQKFSHYRALLGGISLEGKSTWAMLRVVFCHTMGHSYTVQIDSTVVIGLIGQEIISWRKSFCVRWQVSFLGQESIELLILF